MKTILGIDPGMKGAMSFYDGVELLIYDMPTFEIKGRNHLDAQKIKEILIQQKPDFCCIEKLTPMPKAGGLQGFSMGKTEGFWLGIFTGLNIPFTEIRPAQWKKTVQCPADKDGARMRASQLLPNFSHNWDRKKDDGRAESALIAYYGLRHANS